MAALAEHWTWRIRHRHILGEEEKESLAFETGSQGLKSISNISRLLLRGTPYSKTERPRLREHHQRGGVAVSRKQQLEEFQG